MLQVTHCFSFIFCVPFQLNPTVNTFQRKYVNEVKKCEEMERILGKPMLVFANAVHIPLNEL